MRLPKRFRMPGAEVRIRRQGAVVVPKPLESDRAWLDAITGEFSDDLVAHGREFRRVEGLRWEDWSRPGTDP